MSQRLYSAAVRGAISNSQVALRSFLRHASTSAASPVPNNVRLLPTTLLTRSPVASSTTPTRSLSPLDRTPGALLTSTQKDALLAAFFDTSSSKGGTLVAEAATTVRPDPTKPSSPVAIHAISILKRRRKKMNKHKWKKARAAVRDSTRYNKERRKKGGAQREKQE
ncbi:hypothetical protein HKX48_007725 [Thoreauomyces humboldtii]|nr:hypothetical protein HKX48_007725 [Thoreauomyces humboldtii]